LASASKNPERKGVGERGQGGVTTEKGGKPPG